MTESATKSSRNDSRATSAVARAAGKINKNNRSVHLYARVSERSICCGALDINQRLNNLWRQSSTVAATGSKETLFSRQLSDNQYEVCSSIRRVLRINHVPLHLTRLSIKKITQQRELVNSPSISIALLFSMGVDHGGRAGGTSPPQNLERGDANANCPPPPDFVI